MKLEECRKKIDSIDKEMVKLFCERMDAAQSVAEYKKENNMNVYDSERERKLLDSVEENAGEKYGDYARRLYGSMLELSRTYQSSILNPPGEISQRINAALKNTPELFPEKAVVACQGIEGAFSLLACEKLFKKPSVMFCQTFEDVFRAVDSGLCRYGVVPLENSSAGSVNQTYSLMSKYKFSIVRSTKMQVGHCLLANKGAVKENIREIYSHPQAISQCSEFLGSLGDGVKIIPCENTAIAAKKVADSKRTDTAAIASAQCAAQYGLEAIESLVQNTSNNYTRFICFAKNTEIYPGADRTSLLIRTAHRAGALYSVISQFNALGVNIIKLESRPIPETDFEFMFYFDIEVSVYSGDLNKIMDQLETLLGSGNVKYLGSYREA